MTETTARTYHTMESLRQMAQTDLRNVNRKELVDINEVEIRKDLSQRERILNQKEFDEELVHELIKKIYVGIDNSVEIEFKCSDPYQEVLAFVAEVQNE